MANEIDKKHISCSLFLDFKKAFDVVDHDILLHKLYNGVRGLPLEFFKSYLSDQHHFTIINNMKSKIADVKCGVP